MTPSQALARCLSLTIKSRARAQEKIARRYFAPSRGVAFARDRSDRAGRLHAAVYGTRNGRENVERVVRQLAGLQLTAQAGLAATPDLSFLAACLARPILQIDEPAKFLAPLPIETLEQLVCLTSRDYPPANSGYFWRSCALAFSASSALPAR